MAGKRQPTDVVIANGRKHLSKTEEAERRAGEVKVSPAKTAKPPKWLPEALRKDFRAIGKRLIVSGLYTDLDADTLGRYLVAQHQWLIATGEAEKALAQRDQEGADGSELRQRYGPDRNQPLPPGGAGYRQAGDGGQQPHAGADPGRHGSACLRC